jgi:outer membrane autotransporter protein
MEEDEKMFNRGILGIATGLALFAGQAMAATISGEIYAPGVTTVNIGSATVRGIAASGGVLQKRFRQLRNARTASVKRFGSNEAMASPNTSSEFANRIWGSAIYTNIDGDSSQGQVGSGYEYKAWGGALGYDRVFGDFTLGAAFTYTRGDYDAKEIHDDIAVDNYGVSIYATYYNGNGFFGDIFGGYNYGDTDMKMLDNTNAWNSANSHSDSYWIGGTLGYDAKVTESFTLTPSVGLLWMHSEASSYRLGNTRFGEVKQKSLLLPVEAAATYTHQIDGSSKVDFTVKGGYAYDFKNDGGKGVYRVAGVTNAIRGVAPGRHNWNVGAGVKYSRDRFDVGAEYRFDGRKDYKSHTVSATIGINF